MGDILLVPTALTALKTRVKGRWHLAIGFAAVVVTYAFVRSSLSLALTMVTGALLPDFDLLVFSRYAKSKKTGEWKKKYPPDAADTCTGSYFDITWCFG